VGELEILCGFVNNIAPLNGENLKALLRSASGVEGSAMLRFTGMKPMA